MSILLSYVLGICCAPDLKSIHWCRLDFSDFKAPAPHYTLKQHTMGRKPHNTKRGSQVRANKEKQERRYQSLFEHKRRCPAASLADLARDYSLNIRCVQRRWVKFAAAEVRGDIAGMMGAAEDRRGGHNRTFTLAQESLLRDVVLASSPPMGHQQIRGAALQMATDVGIAARRRALRHRHVFTASDGFVSAFKQRNRLSSHRTAVIHISARLRAEGRDLDEEAFQFITEVRGAIDAYGANMVLNMDETPALMCDVPVTAIVRTGSNEAAKITTSANPRLNITTFPCISAAGNKIPLCAVLAGTTERCLAKVRDGASPTINRVVLYYSKKGWINEGIMVRWLADVVHPYTQGAPAALILDSYASHWTQPVLDAAAAMQLELIKVPGGLTSTCQPLDTSFNGPMLKARQRIWRERKIARPADEDTYQATIERTQMAYESMSKEATLKGWKVALLID